MPRPSEAVPEGGTLARRSSPTLRVTIPLIIAAILCHDIASAGEPRTASGSILPERVNSTAANDMSSQRVTLTGCWTGDGRGNYGLSSTDSHSYKLIGNTAKLDDLGRYVQISGTLIESDREAYDWGSIKIETIKELPQPDAMPNPSISRRSNWRTYRSPAYGIDYLLPSSFPRWNYDTDDSEHFEPKLVGKADAVAKFEIPGDEWPGSNFTAGEFAIYAGSEIKSAATCYDLRPTDDVPSTELIHGIKYAHSEEADIPPEGFDYYYTFQNGLCYEIVFDLSYQRLGAMDLGCAVPIMDANSLIVSVLSGILFFPPQQPDLGKNARVQNRDIHRNYR
jgi:hypothetical protein